MSGGAAVAEGSWEPKVCVHNCQKHKSAAVTAGRTHMNYQLKCPYCSDGPARRCGSFGNAQRAVPANIGETNMARLSAKC